MKLNEKNEKIKKTENCKSMENILAFTSFCIFSVY